MEKQGESSGQLQDMLLAARFVDTELFDLEKLLKSIDGLMPDERNKEPALDVANNMYQEVKEIEESIDQLKNVYKSLFDATKAENKKADVAIKSMQEGIQQIEDTLKNYGYDSSNMPECNPENVENDGSVVESSESSLEEVIDEVDQVLPASPEKEKATLSESLLGVEITPMVLRQSFHGSGSSGNHHRKTPLATIKQPAVCANSPQLTTKSKKIEEEKKESSLKPRNLLVKPERPVLSMNY